MFRALRVKAKRYAPPAGTLHRVRDDYCERVTE